ncbi:MAG: PEP-CTERM sorting domain-containing protein [Tepidisphaeraceae bacterium]
MKRPVTGAIAFLCVFTFCTWAWADWGLNEAHKMHYPQLPDMSSHGLDVNATFWGTPGNPSPPIFPFQKVLADDWTCSSSGPVSDIHIWGSWLHDQKFTGTIFHLSIHADIPNSGLPGDYSRPGALLWEGFFDPGEYSQRIWGTTIGERVWDPNTGSFLGTDTLVWQYNFEDIPEPFTQQFGTTYWLDVQALVPPSPSPTDPQFVFGWKTSASPKWKDDAVYGDNDVFGAYPFPQFPDPSSPGGLTPWKDMHHPDNPNESIDLAFVITPEPASLTLIGLAGAVLLLKRR